METACPQAVRRGGAPAPIIQHAPKHLRDVMCVCRRRKFIRYGEDVLIFLRALDHRVNEAWPVRSKHPGDTRNEMPVSYLTNGQHVPEDLLIPLAAMKLGRPVKWEWTREEEFIAATTRHQMTTHVRIGAKKDGTLTALDVRVVSNTGAYGGHGSETLAAAMGAPLAAYRCPNKRGDGYANYTNMTPAGGFRGYGASQTTFAMECAIDELAGLLDIDPVGLVRNRRGPAGEAGLLAQYVNDRPYVASSFLSVAVAQVYGTALAGKSRERPELAGSPLPLEARGNTSKRFVIGQRPSA